MEKTLEQTQSIIEENEKMIAQVLHDVKSPLYSIKIALQNKQDTELNKDIFETVLSTLKYIENFLVNYSFRHGKFENRIDFCNVKEIINQKIENYKYIFIEKNIRIDFILDDGDFLIYSNNVFLSSIIGNIISNIAFHALKGSKAQIELCKRKNNLILNFKNSYNGSMVGSSLGLEICEKLINSIKAQMTFKKTKDSVNVFLKIPDLKTKN